jgi:hypothetical protein
MHLISLDHMSLYPKGMSYPKNGISLFEACWRGPQFNAPSVKYLFSLFCR